MTAGVGHAKIRCKMRRSIVAVSTTRTFSVTLEPAEAGGSIVHAPMLPEIETCAETAHDALAMACEAIELVLAIRSAHGEEIPTEQRRSGTPRVTVQ